ncbi:hypothetical protein RIF29_25164 [Crotalaria pallida]|uniref:Uncharacterized protein n=1 Tax=Crotalaria pallida TaxID=3830 RepID=A0AAN9I0U7_CROPI
MSSSIATKNLIIVQHKRWKKLARRRVEVRGGGRTRSSGVLRNNKVVRAEVEPGDRFPMEDGGLRVFSVLV